MMKIEHVAVYVRDLESTKNFYVKYFGAKTNDKYANPKTGLNTYFLSFDMGARLEIMNRPDNIESDKNPLRMGLIHLAISIGSKEAVDALSRRIESDGYMIASYPRYSGDGYYECCVVDPEGNLVEIVA